MSGMYGRQELPEEPGSSPDAYLQLLNRRQSDQRLLTQPTRYSNLRWRMYSTMLCDPEAEWTAKALATALETDAPAAPHTIDAIHDTVTVMMADQWVEPVPFQQLLTVRLTAVGHANLRQLLMVWTADIRTGEDGA